MQSIGKLLPADGYQVQFKQTINPLHVQSLMQLYQPIIGILPVTLYLTLATQTTGRQSFTHHTLMQNMNVPLTEIYHARLKCEAIGLFNTFKFEDEDKTLYTYQLHLPCEPIDFFENDMLSQLLYHHLSEDHFNKLKQQLSYEKTPHQSGENVTATFTEVFKEEGKQGTPIQHKDEEIKGPHLDNDRVDWNSMTHLLTQRMLPVDHILTVSNMKLIEQMASLYRLTSVELEKAILWALTSENTLDRNEFKAACLDLTHVLPKMINRSIPDTINQTEKVVVSQSKDRPKTKQEQFIEAMETISPKQLLEDLSNGNQASNQDLKVIADVMDKQGINPAVMNVLIHYVMLKSDMKLTKSYLEKIASHWARKNVKTARQAMTLAKAEHNKYQQWGNSSKRFYNKQTNKKEVIPDWFKEQKQEQKTKSQPNVQVDHAKEDVSEMLRKYQEQKMNK